MDLNRRLLLCGGAAFALRTTRGAKQEEVHRFRTANVDIEMTIQFHDQYASNGFWFAEQMSNRHFCLSGSGEEGRDCLSGFRGSLAIAHYRLRPRSDREGALALREFVRTIDRDARLADRPPFERTIVLNQGVGSDLQAFGYQPGPEGNMFFERHGPWYLCRQDLYLEPQTAPFLILYWKQTLSSIRVLDMIPGNETWRVKD
jgi:hypothetical protein